jgi:heat-inducible transcriptional repressor
MNGRELDPRKELILKVVTDDYIESAEPVGSRTIARKYNLGLSPATIRNEMADLEENGYLQQPHISAGRIPSHQGYRYYVDSLMKQQALNKKELQVIQSCINNLTMDLDELDLLLQQTVKVLAQITRYPSLMLGPKLQPSVFTHVQLIPLNEHNILVLVVTNMGVIENKLITVDVPVSQMDLDRISYVLNKKLRGKTFDKLKTSFISELREEMEVHDSLFHKAIHLLLRTLESRDKDRIYLDGIINILDHPEFKELEKFKSLMEMMDEEESIYRMLEKTSGHQGLQISIGEEIEEEAFQQCSVVTATYEIGGKVVGTIGVLGPTRMDYGHVVAVVDFVSHYLSKVLSDMNKYN